MTTSRLESFSDGVIAVAITLLVLNIAVPNPLTTQDLGRALGDQWPVYAAYATSFLTIGIIWINHHVMINRLARPDHSILILNLVLLMSVVLIPFGTSLLASYLKRGSGDHLAAAIYGGTLLVMSIAFYAVNTQILFRRPHLLRESLPVERRRQILLHALPGLPLYVLATALAAVSAYITLAMTAALAIFYALPIASAFEPE